MNFKLLREASYTDASYIARGSSPLLLIVGDAHPALAWWANHLVDINKQAAPYQDLQGVSGAVHLSFACRWVAPLVTTSDQQLLAVPATRHFLLAEAFTKIFASANIEEILAHDAPYSIADLRLMTSSAFPSRPKVNLLLTDFGKVQTKSVQGGIAEPSAASLLTFGLFAASAQDSSLAPVFDFQADLAPFHLQADRDTPGGAYTSRFAKFDAVLQLPGTQLSAQSDADRIALVYTTQAPMPHFLTHYDPTPDLAVDRRVDFALRVLNATYSTENRALACMEKHFTHVAMTFFPILMLIFVGGHDSHYQQFATLVLGLPHCSTLKPFLPSTLEVVEQFIIDSGLFAMLKDVVPSALSCAGRVAFALKNCGGASSAVDGTSKSTDTSAQMTQALNANAVGCQQLCTLLEASDFCGAFKLAFELGVTPIIQSMTGTRTIKGTQNEVFLLTTTASRHLARYLGQAVIAHHATGVIPDHLSDWSLPQSLVDKILSVDWNKIDWENDFINVIDKAIFQEAQPVVMGNTMYLNQMRLRKLSTRMGALVVALGGKKAHHEGSFGSFCDGAISFLSELPATNLVAANSHNMQDYFNMGLKEMSRPFIDALKSANPGHTMPAFTLAPSAAARHILTRAHRSLTFAIDLKNHCPQLARVFSMDVQAKQAPSERVRNDKRSRDASSAKKMNPGDPIVKGALDRMALKDGSKIAIAGDASKAVWYNGDKVQKSIGSKCKWVAISKKEPKVACLFCPEKAHGGVNAPEHQLTQAERDAAQLFRL